MHIRVQGQNAQLLGELIKVNQRNHTPPLLLRNKFTFALELANKVIYVLIVVKIIDYIPYFSAIVRIASK